MKGVANLKKTTGRHEKYHNYANITDAQTNIVNENKRLTKHESDQICQFQKGWQEYTRLAESDEPSLNLNENPQG